MQKPGFFVAVLPVSVGDELQTNPDGVASELRRQIGRDGFYVVSVAGRIGTDPDVPISAGGTLAERLTEIVDQTHVFHAPEDGRSRWWWVALGAVAALLAVAAVALVSRRRSSSRP